MKTIEGNLILVLKPGATSRARTIIDCFDDLSNRVSEIYSTTPKLKVNKMSYNDDQIQSFNPIFLATYKGKKEILNKFAKDLNNLYFEKYQRDIIYTTSDKKSFDMFAKLINNRSIKFKYES